LAVGAPVEFRGLPFGEVTRIRLDYDPETFEFATPVDLRIYPGRLRARLRHGSFDTLDDPQETVDARIRRMVDHGLRAQLRTASLLTGQRFVAMDFFPAAPRVKLDPVRRPREIPTVAGEDEDLQAALTGVARKVSRLPLEEVGPILGDVRRVLGNANTAFANVDAAVSQFGPSSPRQADLEDVLQQVARAARSVRALADSLERHPESLIRGRP
jgi:paraquat-inducible protein B